MCESPKIWRIDGLTVPLVWRSLSHGFASSFIHLRGRDIDGWEFARAYENYDGRATFRKADLAGLGGPQLKPAFLWYKALKGADAYHSFLVGPLMACDQVAILKEIAKRSGKKIKTLNLFDPAVCKSPLDPKRPWLMRPLPGDLFRDQVSFEHQGRKLKLRANADFMVADICGNFDVAAACSINRRTFGKELKERIPGFPSLPVFTSAANSDTNALLHSPILQRALGNLSLKEQESLHIHTDAIVLYLQRSSLEEVTSAITVACTLADELPLAVMQDPNLSDLPEQFQVLNALVDKWAISDDEERTERINDASESELDRLVQSVIPLLPAINDYMQSFGIRPPSEAATVLGTLAECALEAQLQLKRSPKSDESAKS